MTARGEQRRLLLAAYAKDAAVVEQAIKGVDEAVKLQKERIKQIEPLLVTAEGKKMVADIDAAMTKWEENELDVEKLVKAGKAAGMRSDPRQVKLATAFRKICKPSGASARPSRVQRG